MRQFITSLYRTAGVGSLLRQGGLIVIDNTLWGGQVADSTVQDQATVAIRTLNEKIHQDSRVNLCLLPMADGITLVSLGISRSLPPQI